MLKNILDPLHSKFFDRVNQLPGGMKFLIDMRADLLVYIISYLFHSKIGFKAAEKAVPESKE